MSFEDRDRRVRRTFLDAQATQEQQQNPQAAPRSQTAPRFPDRNSSGAARSSASTQQRRRLHPIEQAFGVGAQIDVPDHELMPDEPMTEDEVNAWREERRAEAGFYGGAGSQGRSGSNFAIDASGPFKGKRLK